MRNEGKGEGDKEKEGESGGEPWAFPLPRARARPGIKFERTLGSSGISAMFNSRKSLFNEIKPSAMRSGRAPENAGRVNSFEIKYIRRLLNRLLSVVTIKETADEMLLD